MCGQYFSIWLLRQECLDNISLFGKRDKSAWTIFLVTEATMSGQYFSVW